MVIINKDYTIENINTSGLAFLKKKKEDVVGKKCYQVFHNTSKPAEYCPFLEVLKTGKASSTEHYESKFRRYISIKTSPVIDKKGGMLRFVDIIRDITEHKTAEDAIRKRSDELERFNRLAVGRELRMVGLKKRIKHLERLLEERDTSVKEKCGE
jgi:PAS domain S-box-containing protein